MSDEDLADALEQMSRTFAYAVRRDELTRAASRIRSLNDELRMEKAASGAEIARLQGQVKSLEEDLERLSDYTQRTVPPR